MVSKDGMIFLKKLKKEKTKLWGFGEAERCLYSQLHALVEGSLTRTLQRSAGAQHPPFKELQVQEDDLGGPKKGGRML